MYLDTVQARLLATGLPVLLCPARLRIAFENMMKALTRPSKPAVPPIRPGIHKGNTEPWTEWRSQPAERETQRGGRAGVLVQGALRQTRACAGPDENLPNTHFKCRSAFEASRRDAPRPGAELQRLASLPWIRGPLPSFCIPAANGRSCRSESASEFSGEPLTSSSGDSRDPPPLSDPAQNVLINLYFMALYV